MVQAPPPTTGNHVRGSACPTKGSADSKKFLLVDCARLNAFTNEFKNCRIFLCGAPPWRAHGGDRQQRSFMRQCVREREEEGLPAKRKKKRRNGKGCEGEALCLGIMFPDVYWTF